MSEFFHKHYLLGCEHNYNRENPCSCKEQEIQLWEYSSLWAFRGVLLYRKLREAIAVQRPTLYVVQVILDRLWLFALEQYLTAQRVLPPVRKGAWRMKAHLHPKNKGTYIFITCILPAHYLFLLRKRVSLLCKRFTCSTRIFTLSQNNASISQKSRVYV